MQAFWRAVSTSGFSSSDAAPCRRSPSRPALRIALDVVAPNLGAFSVRRHDGPARRVPPWGTTKSTQASSSRKRPQAMHRTSESNSGQSYDAHFLRRADASPRDHLGTRASHFLRGSPDITGILPAPSRNLPLARGKCRTEPGHIPIAMVYIAFNRCAGPEVVQSLRDRIREPHDSAVAAPSCSETPSTSPASTLRHPLDTDVGRERFALFLRGGRPIA